MSRPVKLRLALHSIDLSDLVQMVVRDFKIINVKGPRGMKQTTASA